MENLQSNIHIGQLIREQLKADQRSASWLAREIGCSRNHLYKVFRKPSLDGELLLSISLAMNFNFFRYYTTAFHEGLKARLGEETC
ncbi:MAG: XRE family transcriptional regulator [Bacteroidales bacterium]|nr:XRE family transcriptional regulator [Bacteroidales bacterium]